jgi:hypothetical protein
MDTLTNFEKSVRMIKAMPDKQPEQRKYKGAIMEAVISQMTPQIPPSVRPLWDILFIESERTKNSRMLAVAELAEQSWNITAQQAFQAAQALREGQRP